MKPFKKLLASSAEEHGHLCPGQVVGVRMAMLGCRLIGLEEPASHDQIKKLIVFVELDRCTADALAHVTGAKLGRRSLKLMDYGIMAGTFLNLETGISYRILSTEEARSLAHVFAPEVEGRHARQLEAYKRMPDSVLFRVQRVDVQLHDQDFPGPTRYKAVCARCGQGMIRTFLAPPGIRRSAPGAVRSFGTAEKLWRTGRSFAGPARTIVILPTPGKSHGRI